MKARVSATRAEPASKAIGRAPARQHRVALPHADAMLRRFGPRVAHVPVYAGPPVAAALRTRHADAAALDGAVFLKDSNAAADLVAHELAHALQQPRRDYLGGDHVSTTAMLQALATAPVTPAAGPAEAEAQALATTPGPVAPVQALPAGTAALRRTPTPATDAADPEALAVTTAPTPEARTPEARTEAPAAPAIGLAPPAPAEPLAPTFTPPEPPDTAIDPAVAEARAAAAAEGQAALAAAETPSAAMAAYAALAPSQQGLAAATLGERLAGTAAGTAATLVAATPEVTVAIAANAVPLPEPVALDASPPVTGLVPDAPAAAVTIPDAPVQPQLVRPPDVARTMEQRFADGATPDGIFDTLRAVQTGNPGVVTSITDRAAVPLEDDTDPALLDQATANSATAAAGALTDATTAIVAGRGPEAVAPRDLAHAATLPEIETRPSEALAAPPEAAELERLALPAEVVAGFDAASGAQMATSTAAAREAMTTAETEQQTAHQVAVGAAETQRADVERTAQTEQRDVVVAQREAIQTERQRTVTAQGDAVAAVEADAETARRDHHDQVDTRIAADRAAIDTEYNAAETRAAAEVATAEREAQAAREQADRDAANQSWWDRAADFIGDVFDALVDLIGDLFDAVRAAVGAILDAVGDIVKGLIDLAASAIKGLISALGEALKLLVDGLIGTIFPELAARLNGYIDSAVTAANSAVDAVADRLKAGVDAIVERLKSAINSLLDVFQGAINAALALVQAAITGDWSGLLLKVLDAVLGILGIDPAAFHELIAQATTAIETIVNDPAAFVGNMIDAVTGGIQRFIDNFGSHLQRGIISWLTGALGNITLPDRWDLAGVLDLARQVTGLTWDFVRERATRLIGAANVARLEIAFDWIATLVTEGFPALFQRIYDGLNDLTGGVLEAIRSFLVERVLMGAITWLASIFNPVGAIVKLVMTIWNIYQFLKNQLARLMAIVTSVVRSIAEIAAGNLEPAIAAIDGVLGNLLPVAIDLLMSLLGVTGVAARVREILQMVRDRIAAAIDALLARVVAAFRGGRGATAGAAATTPGAANDNSLGHPVPVDVATGPDHVLSIDRTGPGGATVMLRSEPLPLAAWLTRLEPLANRIAVPADKDRALADIAAARTILAQLEIAADAAAASAPAPRPGTPAAPRATPAAVAALVTSEERLAPILVRIFNAVDGAGGAFADQFATQLHNVHPAALAMIRQELRTNAAAWSQLAGWDAVVTAMKAGSVLFTDPLDGGRSFGEAARTALHAAIRPVAPATAVEPAESARILTYVRQQVRANDGSAFQGLRTRLHTAILTGDLPAVDFAAAITAARAYLNASTDVDAGLRAAVERMGLQPFLIAMAENRTVPADAGNTIGPAAFDRLWKAAGGGNKDFIAGRFRSPAGLHEWIPTNYIPDVLARARDAPEEEGIEFAALWVRAHDAWRTDTEILIYKPGPGFTRRISVGPPNARRDVTILQGHVGAVYAKADDEGVVEAPQQQTIGQGPWHEELRTRFDTNAAATRPSKAALAAVIDSVDRYARESLWQGTPVTGLDATVFDDYYDSSRARRIGVAGVTANAARAFSVIEADFERARAVAR